MGGEREVLWSDVIVVGMVLLDDAAFVGGSIARECVS